MGGGYFLLIGIAAMSVIYFINLFFSGRMIAYKIITLASFISFFLLYLQGNFLSGKLPTLTGERIIWANYGKTENVILIIALIALIIAAIILVRKVKLDRTLSYASAGTGIVSLILAIALVSTIIRNDTFMKKDTFAATTKNFNTISSNKNFLIFVADTVDSKAFYDVMSKDKDFKGMFEDFTYYPDTLSVYGNTTNSIVNILTGAVNHYETSYLDYCSKAYNKSPFFEKLKRSGFAINLYSEIIAWNGKRNFNIENSTSIRDIKVNFYDFKKQVWRYVRFKYLPYGYKQYSHIEAMDFNSCRVEGRGKTELYSWKNKTNYDQIQKKSTLNKSDENYFQFIHCEGNHSPFNMDKYLMPIKDGAVNGPKIAASLTLIKAYLQRLKNNNSYDNSVIVIMADHGFLNHESDGSTQSFMLGRHNPMLLIKGFNEKHEMIVSDLPVSYMDLQNAFFDLIDGKKSTELFADIKQGRTRTALAYLWHPTLYTDITEFITTGKAWEIEKFTPTGNVYTYKK